VGGTYRWNDKFPGQQANSGQRTICNKRQSGEWVNGGVNIGQPLQAFQVATFVPIPERAMATEQNFHRPKRPS
jgi:hypothetical protein